MAQDAKRAKHGVTVRGTVNTPNEQQQYANKQQYVGYAGRVQGQMTHGQQTTYCPLIPLVTYGLPIAPVTVAEGTNRHAEQHDTPHDQATQQPNTPTPRGHSVFLGHGGGLETHGALRAYPRIMLFY